MTASESIRDRSWIVLRDVAIATGVLVGLYGLGVGVQFQPLQIPGYLLIVGFDLLENAFGSAGARRDLIFGAYLLGLGVAGATVAHVIRGRARTTARWRVAAAGAVSVVGLLSLTVATILLGGSQMTPVLVTAGAGVVLLAVAAWLAGSFDTQED